MSCILVCSIVSVFQLSALFHCLLPSHVRSGDVTKLSSMKLNLTVSSWIVTSNPTAHLHFLYVCVCVCEMERQGTNVFVRLVMSLVSLASSRSWVAQAWGASGLLGLQPGLCS